MAFGTQRRGRDSNALGAFQSLFFWNGLWDPIYAAVLWEMMEFQSLFFWNGLWD